MNALGSKLKALTRLRCEIFQTSTCAGPAMVKYYPEVISLSSIAREFPKMGIVDPVEVQRLADVEDKKRRGKGTPKKAKDQGRRTAKRR
ncbi:hypothetical protein B0H14DRAFT_2707303 [Mycena olivaceomarginata]|nr:hypothetical protein B0H14DRAFT_2707303 [Mycena olivaceomarginata]